MALSAQARSRVASFVTNDLWAGAPHSVDYFGGIIGGEEPSRYSLSPRLWNSFFRHIGVAGFFSALDLPQAEALPDFLACLVELPECVDITVTSPYKAAACDCLERLPPGARVTDRVQRLHCLNHIIADHGSGTLHVDNTDGQGMIHALQKRRRLQNARVLLVGAGGAAASIGHELAVAGAELTIANIVAEDANALKLLLEPLQTGRAGIRAGGWELIEAAANSSDIIISAITESTPLTESQLDRLPGHCLCADTRYGANGAFAQAAKRAGRQWIDGREMLFGQFQLAAERVAALLKVDPRPAFNAIERAFIA